MPINNNDPWVGAACRDPEHNPDWWHATNRTGTDRAVQVCTGCELQRRCLRHALVHHEQHGVWGGISEQYRRKLRARLVDDLDDRPMDGSPELDRLLDAFTAPPATVLALVTGGAWS